MSGNCPGLITSQITGESMCPKDVVVPDGQAWEQTCDDCRANQERWAELNAEAAMERAVWHVTAAREREPS